VSGGGLNGFSDCLGNRPEIDWVLVPQGSRNSTKPSFVRSIHYHFTHQNFSYTYSADYVEYPHGGDQPVGSNVVNRYVVLDQRPSASAARVALIVLALALGFDCATAHANGLSRQRYLREGLISIRLAGLRALEALKQSLKQTSAEHLKTHVEAS
jgi:hypothetical protein